MNKSKLINKVAEKTGLNKKDSGNALAAIVESITDSLIAKQKVTLVGFGTFTTSERKERKGRNPQTGEEITIQAKTSPVFKPGEPLKAKVAGK